MNTLLRTLTAAGPTLTRTGATPQSQAAAQNQQAAQEFNANSHPRGADGRFIQTGGTVQVLGGPNGKTPIAEGQATIIQTGQGPLIQVKSATTGQVFTVPPHDIQAAPQSVATLGAKGSQGIPLGAGAPARSGASDARKGIPPRSGTNELGEKADPARLAEYLAAYKATQAKMKVAAAKKAAAAAKKSAKASAGPAPAKSVMTKSARRYYR